jgi:SH3-like domain-containing protein
MLVEIVTPYIAQYPDAIRFAAGERVQVGRDDPEFPGWFWCGSQAGGEGWVHQSFLDGIAGEVIAVEDYSADELTVAEGECGTLIRRLDAWACVRLESGEQGWVPESHLRMPR